MMQMMRMLVTGCRVRRTLVAENWGIERSREKCLLSPGKLMDSEKGSAVDQVEDVKCPCAGMFES